MSNKHSDSKKEIPQEIEVLNILIKEGYEKIITDYLKIEKTLNILNKDIPIKIKDSFSNIIIQIENMQKYFKSYINSINNSISSLLSNLNLENINLEINSSVKQSYSQICDEFCKIESITKEVISNKEKLKNQRKNRIKLLEKRLQSYCDEINNFDFSKIINLYDYNIKDNERISNVILKNQKMEQYKLIDINDNIFDLNNNKNNSKVNKNSSTESDTPNPINNILAYEIAKLNTDKEEDLIDLIQSFSKKGKGKENKETGTIKRNIS